MGGIFLRVLVGKVMEREGGCPIENVGHDGREEDGFPLLPMARGASSTARGDDGQRKMGRTAEGRGMPDRQCRA